MVLFLGSHKEFTRKGNVDRHITVHSMFTQHIDAKFFACFCEPKLAVQREHIGENSTTMTVIHKV
jgi:hypothetical protein